MSAMMVHDVTKSMQAMPGVARKTKSVITPFRSVLKQETERAADAAPIERTAAPETGRIAASAPARTEAAGGASGGETTLKDIFERASQKYGVSYEFLLAVAKAESDFNPRCVSSAGAQGIMQVMPQEQKGLGIKDPFDPEQNIMGSAKLLKAHLDKFDGDYTLAAAAYNAGSGAVKKYGGVPPYKETQNYVKKIKKFMEEGVTVPDRKASTSSQDSTVGSGASAGVSEAKGASRGFDQGTKATDSDLEKVTVSVGTGDGAITMTYGAYLKYLEIGNAGVG